MAACTTAPFGMVKFILFYVLFYTLSIPSITVVYSKYLFGNNKTKMFSNYKLIDDLTSLFLQ